MVSASLYLEIGEPIFENAFSLEKSILKKVFFFGLPRATFIASTKLRRKQEKNGFRRFFLYSSKIMNRSNLETIKFNEYINFNFSIRKFFYTPNQSIFYTSIIYLLITLFAVVKISNINIGPLRPKN